MGWKSEAVVANLVIVEGPNDGLFVYQGTPAAGNLKVAIAAQAGTDSFGNTYAGGINIYASPGLISFASLNPSTRITSDGALAMTDALIDSARPEIALAAPNTSALAAAQLSLFAESKDATAIAQALVSIGGGAPVTLAIFEVQGSAAVQAGKAAGVTGTPSLVVGGAVAAGDALVHIADDPLNPRSGSANLLQIEDHSAAPVFAVGAAGGAKVFGDKNGSWNGIGSMAAQLVPWYGAQIGGSSGSTLYSGSGAPLPALITGGLTTYSQTAHVGDYYFRTDTPAVANQRIYVCTVAGNPGTWVGIL